MKETKLDFKRLQDSENVNDLLTEEQSNDIGRLISQWYEADKGSRSRWEKQMEEANNLALQVAEPKTYPWPKASNVKFPLITIASMQFAARSYPALVKAPDIVKMRIQGKDDGTKAARAQRVSSHMSYQLLEQDEPWEEHHDRMLLVLPIAGTAFKKSYFDKVKGHNCSKLVLPKNLVVHYYAKSIEDAERKTEVFQISPRKLKERQLRKIYSTVELGPVPIDEEDEAKKREGMIPPTNDDDAPRTILECHCYLDLDGDGYKEPYVVTVDKHSRRVLRIVQRFGEITTEQSIKIEQLMQSMRSLAEGAMAEMSENPSEEQRMQAERVERTLMAMKDEVERLSQEKPKILRIKPIEYYTKYTFIPSPDGGFYGLGFGSLLGPLNNSVNTLINQLIDSGSLQNGSQGFIGKGARIKGGKVRFEPYEWKRVPVAGGTLRDSLVPLPVNSPSPVLFDLLSLLITYAERVGSVTDAMVGENPGQNTPAYNMSAMLEQGLQVFNGIFKRIYGSMRAEFRKLYNLNAVYLNQEEYFTYQDADAVVLRTDYTGDPKDLIPAADPNAFSNKEKVEKAMLIVQRSAQVPGYNPIEIEKRWLEAMDIPDAAQLFPLQQNQETGAEEYVFPPQPDPELEIKKADMQRRTMEGKVRGEVDIALADSKMAVDEANIALMYAKASKEMDSQELERLRLILEDVKSKRESLLKKEELQIKREEVDVKRIAARKPDSGVDRKPSN